MVTEKVHSQAVQAAQLGRQQAEPTGLPAAE